MSGLFLLFWYMSKIGHIFQKSKNIDFCLLNIYKVFLFISKSTFIQKETFVEQPNRQIYEQAIWQTRGKREWNLVNTKKCTILSRVQSYLDHVIIWLCHHVIILLFSILVHMARLANIISTYEQDYQSFKKTIEHKTVVSMCQ